MKNGSKVFSQNKGPTFKVKTFKANELRANEEIKNNKFVDIFHSDETGQGRGTIWH